MPPCCCHGRPTAAPRPPVAATTASPRHGGRPVAFDVAMCRGETCGARDVPKDVEFVRFVEAKFSGGGF